MAVWCSSAQSPQFSLTRALLIVTRRTQTWDLRTLSRPMGEIKMAHKQPVRSISFAPHADTRILTAGDDCKLRYWDLRCAQRCPRDRRQ